MIKVRTLAKNYAPLAAIVTDADTGALKVYRNVAPEGTKEPFLVWTMVSGNPLNYQDCPNDTDKYELQFDCYHYDDELMEDFANITRDFINSFARFTGYLPYPEEVGVYRESMSGFLIDTFR